jgi:hypothetical protein
MYVSLQIIMREFRSGAGGKARGVVRLERSFHATPSRGHARQSIPVAQDASEGQGPWSEIPRDGAASWGG